MTAPIYLLHGALGARDTLRPLVDALAPLLPPDTAVQKRNPFKQPATFLSWFLVDPDEPFAPKASF